MEVAHPKGDDGWPAAEGPSAPRETWGDRFQWHLSDEPMINRQRADPNYIADHSVGWDQCQGRSGRQGFRPC